MKKCKLALVFSMICLLFISMTGFKNVQAKEKLPKYEMRAVLISTDSNTDVPPDSNEKEFTEWARQTVKTLHQQNFNTIIYQVDPISEAPDPPNTVSTDEKEHDTNSNYDSLQLMINLAHDYGMSLHAWVDPYRLSIPDMTQFSLAEENQAEIEADWIVPHNNHYYLNPDIPEVKDYVVSTITELVEHYDVDAIHMDDSFYPDDTFDDEAAYEIYGKEMGTITDWRSHTINQLMEELHLSMKKKKPWVHLGVSTAGNVETDDSNMVDSSYLIQEEVIDYIAPKIHTPLEAEEPSYETLVDRWSEQVKGHNVHLYIGMGDHQVSDSPDRLWNNPGGITDQIKKNRENKAVKGQVHYAATFLEECYSNKALSPPTRWNGIVSPVYPTNIELIEHKNKVEIKINPTGNRVTKKYAIYRFAEEAPLDYSNPENLLDVIYHGDKEMSFMDETIEKDTVYTYGFYAISATGVESLRPYEIMTAVTTASIDDLMKEVEKYDEQLYTEESFLAFRHVLKEVKEVLEDENIRQAEVNVQLARLKQAVAELESIVIEEIPEEINLEPLHNLINEAKAVKNGETKYTEETLKALEKAIQIAMDSLPFITTKEKFEQEYAALQFAIENLEKIIEEEPIEGEEPEEKEQEEEPDIGEGELENPDTEENKTEDEHIEKEETEEPNVEETISPEEIPVEEEQGETEVPVENTEEEKETEQPMESAPEEIEKPVENTPEVTEEIVEPDKPINKPDDIENESEKIEESPFNPEMEKPEKEEAVEAIVDTDKPIDKPDNVESEPEKIEETASGFEMEQLEKEEGETIEAIDETQEAGPLSEQRMIEIEDHIADPAFLLDDGEPAESYLAEKESAPAPQKIGGKLPITATSLFDWLLLGIVFLAIGSVLVCNSRNKVVDA